ncbi:MAG: hypothetical protein LBQ54_01305 [Planctomycetaceae bacterium]|nr:hypothetical protein [Planctomycetaceae bacterium]
MKTLNPNCVGLLLFSLFSISAVAVHAAETGIDRIDVGIYGIYKTGYWVPVTVYFSTAASEEGDLVAETVDSDGVPVEYLSRFSKGSDHAVVSVRPGQKGAAIKVTLTSSNQREEKIILPKGNPNTAITQKDLYKEVASTSQSRFLLPVDSDRPVYLVLSSGNLGIQEALDLMENRDSARPILVPITSFADLPQEALGYESIDTVILSTEPEIYNGMTAQSKQIAALKEWLRLGGHVIFAAGKSSEPLIAGEDAPLAAFLPGTFERMTTLRLASPYEIYAAPLQPTGSTPMNMTGSDDAPFLEVPFFRDVQGKVEAQEGDLPIAVHSSYGLGLLTYFAGDLEKAPLSNWKDRRFLIARLFGVKERRPEQPFYSGQGMIHLGYHDLAGQLRSALERFPDVRVISFSVLVVFSVFYILIVGPGDWFVVHKLLKRPKRTWVTFPCWVILFCGLVVVIAGMFRTGQTVLNQVDLIDIDTRSGTVRGTSWMSFYSPKTAEYNLRYQPWTANPEENAGLSARFAWFGLAGNALGGMSAKTMNFAQWEKPYGMNSSAEITRLPMLTASTKSLTANWLSTAKDLFAGDLTEVDEIPSGHIINTLDWDLEQCFLVYGRWMIELKTVAAGALIEVNSSCKRRDLRTVLAGGQHVFDDDRIGSQRYAGRYNAESADIPYILRTMMFYSAAGGQKEFVLQNGYQQTIDMSRLLLTQNAIFIGIAKPRDKASFGSQIFRTDGAMDGTRIDASQKTVIFRAVFPIDQRADVGSR